MAESRALRTHSGTTEIEHHDGGTARWAALPVLAAAQFIVILDASIVNIAIPTIERDLGFAATDLQWIINAYVLTFGGLLLFGGRLTDLLDGRRVFIAGLGIFAVASALCALATSPGVLLGGRALQGVGAAILSPAGLSLLTSGFTGRRRAVALGARDYLAKPFQDQVFLNRVARLVVRSKPNPAQGAPVPGAPDLWGVPTGLRPKAGKVFDS